MTDPFTTFKKPITGWARAIIFDFDLTLGDSSEAITDCINKALQGVGVEPRSAEEIRKLIGLPLRDIFQRYAPAHIDIAQRLFIERADQVMTATTVLYPGVAELLRRLTVHTDLRFAIVSTKNHNRLEQITEKFGLRDAFQALVGADDVSRPKPAPDPTLRALQQLGCSADEAVFIGDTLADAGSAVAAGVPFVGVTSGTTSEAQLVQAGAVCVYANVVEALEDLLQLQGSAAAEPLPQPYRFTSEEEVRKEVEITVYKSSGPGGQKKNKTESAVRIKHLPTGIIVVATESRSQRKNRELAWQRLIDRLQRLNQKPKKRLPVKVPKAVKEARLQEKRARGQKKQWRQRPSTDE